MSSVTLFVGLDYHQSFVQVCVLDPDGRVLSNRKCPNSWNQIIQQVPPNSQVFAAIEACTGAANLAEELIEQGGWSVSLAHAGYVAKLKRNPDKTDFTDARLLADLERVGYLPKVWLPPEQLRHQRQIVRYREQLAKERRNRKLRVSALLRELRIQATGRRWTKAWLQWIKEVELPPESRWVLDRHLSAIERIQQEINEVEREMETIFADDPIVRQLSSYRGIGLVTAAILRVEIGRFDRFRTGRQLSHYCGLSPRNASSGQKQADAGLVKTGNTHLRTALIEAAHRLAQFDERWGILKRNLRSRGKTGSVAAAAVANRWVRWLYYQMVPQAA